MGWLASGGVDFSYRMSIPVANPSTAGDRWILVPFPAWYLRALGKISQTAYQDVHVTKADGVTELPVSIVPALNGLQIDYASMPVGRTTLYVYYGHAAAAAPTASVLGAERGGTLLDYGAERGVLGATVANPPWFPDPSLPPTTYAYDHTYPRGGRLRPPVGDSLMEMQVVAPAGNYGGLRESATSGLNQDGAEIRFWIYLDNTTKRRQLRDSGDASTRAHNVWWESNGTIQVVTLRTATGYTTGSGTVVGNYAASTWYQVRLVFNFTNKTHTLSVRTRPDVAWTQLKASGAPDYNIPMHGSGTPTQLTGSQFFGQDSAQFWLDDYQYSATGITDAAIDTTLLEVLAIDANEERVSEAAAGGVWYVWGRNIEMTSLDSANPATAYGTALAHKAGVTNVGVKSHGLLKFFEGSLPKGTVSAATLALYLESAAGLGATTTLKAHKLLTWGTADSQANYVRTGWTIQKRQPHPTWNNRYFDYGLSNTAKAWEAGGAVGAHEVDLSDADAPSLVLAAGESLGYKGWAIPAAWLNSWLGDAYSQGVLLKEANESGSTQRTATFSAPSRANGPVLAVTFSSYDAAQLTGRKITTHTFAYATFPTSNPWACAPSDNTFAALTWINADMGLNVALLSPDGRSCLYTVDTGPGGYLNTGTGGVGFGLHYDPIENRYWLAGAAGVNQEFAAAYSLKTHLPKDFIWAVKTGEQSAKSSILPRNGIAYCVSHGTTTGVNFFTFTRSTATWSANTVLASRSASGTMRTLASAIGSGDLMAGDGVLALSGTPDNYPPVGSVLIDSEAFWYTGTGSTTLTGVTRAIFGTTAAAHASGASVGVNRGFSMYAAIAHDGVRNCMHVGYQIANNTALQGYVHGAYLRHYYADGNGVWKDEANNTVTLPLTQLTERRLLPTPLPTYFNGIAVTDQGHVLMSFTCATNFLYYTDAWLLRLPYGDTAFDAIDFSPNLGELGFLDLGAGHVRLTGVGSTTFQIADSMDGGASFSAATALSTHAFPAPGNALWCSTVSRNANLDGKGLAYYQHFAPNGALYVDLAALAATAVMRKFVLEVMWDGSVERRWPIPLEVRGAIARRYRLPFSYEALVPLARAFHLELDALRGLGRRYALPFESDGDLILSRRFPMPVETLTARGRALTLPVEASAGILSRTFLLPVEAGTGIGRAYRLPAEWSGDLTILRRFGLPLETRQRLARQLGLPVEAAGQTDSLPDVWRVYRTLSELFGDEWRVIPVSVALEFLEAWDVKSAMGMELIDTWRVLPPQILTLWSGDIQLPSATMEKQ
jgi:hypothetical protein